MLKKLIMIPIFGMVLALVYTGLVCHDVERIKKEKTEKARFVAKVAAKVCKKDKRNFAIITNNAETILLTEDQYNQVEIGEEYSFEGTVIYQPSIQVDSILIFN